VQIEGQAVVQENRDWKIKHALLEEAMAESNRRLQALAGDGDAAIEADAKAGRGGFAREMADRERRLSAALVDIEHVRAERDAFVLVLAGVLNGVLAWQAGKHVSSMGLWYACM